MNIDIHIHVNQENMSMFESHWGVFVAYEDNTLCKVSVSYPHNKLNMSIHT